MKSFGELKTGDEMLNYFLSIKNDKEFKEWWKQNKQSVDFNEDYVDEFITGCSRFFKIWWPECDDINYSIGLALIDECPEYFHYWWPKMKTSRFYKLQDFSENLVDHCPMFINEWWDSKYFDWDGHSWLLPDKCSKYFHLWWDPNKIDWQSGLDGLKKYCGKYFEYWWIPEKIGPALTSLEDKKSLRRWLEKNQKDKKNIWKKDYILISCSY